jgi:type I restriction enzyme, S subunit
MSKQINTNHSHHSELPIGWEVKEFGEVAEIIMGQSPDGTTYNQDGTGTALINGPTEFTDKYPVKIQWTSLPTKLCKAGDVLLCVRGSSTGRINIANDVYCIGRGIAAIRAKKNFEHSFLEFQIESIVDKILSLTNGSTFPNIDGKSLRGIEIVLPPLPEQKAIADLLHLMDTAINKNNLLIEKKLLQKKWLMQMLLTGKMRLKGFEKTMWRIQALENLVQPVIREVDKPQRPYLALGIRSHGKGTFLKPDEIPEKNSMEKLYVVRPNDLIVNITFAWEHAIAIVNQGDDGALVSHRFPTYEFISGKGHHDFFKFFILLQRMKHVLQLISPGGAGRNRVLDKSDFLNLEFLIPDYDEQIAIGRVLQAADKEIQLLKQKTEKLREEKKGLMQVLLTGKKRLTIKK